MIFWISVLDACLESFLFLPPNCQSLKFPGGYLKLDLFWTDLAALQLAVAIHSLRALEFESQVC